MGCVSNVHAIMINTMNYYKLLVLLYHLKIFTDRATAEENARFWAGLLAALGVCAATALFMRSLCFGIAGQALTSRLRKLSLRHILKQVYTCIYITLGIYVATIICIFISVVYV